jgi:hypothetical protein
MTARIVPPGRYICLQRRATADECRDLKDADRDDSYMPIMSDTPSEIAEHMHAFEYAYGNVLITGLGLGVLVSALLAKPCDYCEGSGRNHENPAICCDCWGTGKAVNHITVVEIDRDVLALTGPYYADHPRVTLVNADAIHYAEACRMDGAEVLWNYAWHDIWSSISYRNLDDDLAEHGISYGMMFRAYEDLAEEQAAWAYDKAEQQRTVDLRQSERELAWVKAMLAGDTETRVRLLAERIIRESLHALDAEQPIPPEVWELFESPEMPSGPVTAYARRIVEEQGIDEDALLREVVALGTVNTTPMGRPNEAPEANVA